MDKSVVKDDYSILTLFSVRDLVEGAYGLPLAYAGPHAEERVRDLFKRSRETICAETNGARKPTDYDLYRVGTFDAQTGVFTTEPNGPSLLV